MDISIETESIRLLETLLGVPASERSAWLDDQRLAANVAARVRELLGAEDMLGMFLAEPLVAPLPGHRSASLPIAGDRFGAWRLLREIGAGTMGVVFLAERADGRYEQQVAIKLVRSLEWSPDAATQADLMRRFDNERRLLARLEHPNIVRILDGGSTPSGTPYLVMEHVAGRSLTDYCCANRLDVAARVELLAKVCDGVQAAHRHLIVHRDLKPQNVLVDDNAEPRVVDFGIARLLETDEAGSVVATRTAYAAMTPAYASPEQARHEPLTTASDVYSLGVMLYELLAGVRPYALAGLSPAECERVICATEPPSLRKTVAASALDPSERRWRAAGIGNDLERIVARALHKDPQRRYGSAQALGDDLRRHLEGRPVLAHPDGIGYRLGKFVRRNRLGSAASALALIAILVAGGIALWQSSQARRAAADMARINTFLVDLLSASNPYESGTEITLAHALDNAAGEIDERFGDRPDLAVDIRYALGKSMLARYRLDAAGIQLQRTLEESTRAFGADDPRTIRAIASLASLRKEQGRDAETTALYTDALTRIQRSGQANGALHANVLNDFGVFYLILGEYARAQEILQQALDVGDSLPVPVSAQERAQTLGSLGQAARGLGDLDRAEALYQQAQTVFETAYPDGGPYLAIILNSRAVLARARKEPEQALGFLERAVAMHRRSFEGDHAMVLVPMTNLARQAIELDRTSLAAEWGEKAVAMAARMYTKTDHFYHAQALTTLAEVRLMQERDADASDLLIRAQQSLGNSESAHAPSQEYIDRIRERLCASSRQATWPACEARG